MDVMLLQTLALSEAEALQLATRRKLIPAGVVKKARQNKARRKRLPEPVSELRLSAKALALGVHTTEAALL